MYLCVDHVLAHVGSKSKSRPSLIPRVQFLIQSATWSCFTCLLVLALFVVSGCSKDHSLIAPRPSRSVRVSVDGDGDFTTIQAAINASAHGDTILLANGRYRGDGNRDLMPGGKRLMIRSERGDPAYCLITCDGSESDPHSGVLLGARDGVGFAMDGITIESGYMPGGGGAVECRDGAKPKFNNMVFRKHLVAAVVVRGSSPVIENSQFKQNTGSALVVNDGTATLSNCQFIDSFSDYSGGAILASSSDVVLNECQFVRSSAVLSGAAISIGAGPPDGTSRLQATGCLFVNNLSGYHGGGVECIGTECEFVGCIFVHNATGVNGGGAYLSYDANGSFVDCLFYDNQATKGSAINCSSSHAELSNCIVSGNTTGPAMFCSTAFGPATIDVICSDVFGNEFGDWTDCTAGQLGRNGNISVEPLFCDTSADDFHLSPNSPCASDRGCGLIGPLPVGCEVQTSASPCD